MNNLRALALLSCSLLAACGSESSGSDVPGETGVDAGVDVQPLCFDTPARLVVLGDSITACVGVGGKNSSNCGPKAFHSYLKDGHAPDIEYQNVAVSGAITTNVVDSQLATVPTGPGHALVLAYVGGNDLRQYLLGSDAQATAGIEADLPVLSGDWESMFSFFEDKTNFPDGATVIINNQYNPFDGCTAAPYNLSAIKNELINTYNEELTELAAARDNVVLVDQYTPYLGHGHHYNDASCPHFEEGSTPFMQDLIHPNEAGHANLAEQWNKKADDIYQCE